MAETKKVSLNISERLYGKAILNQTKGNLEFLSQAVEDIKEIDITEEEWVKAERKETKDEKGELLSINWNDEKGGEKEIVLQDKVYGVIKNAIKEKDEKGELLLNPEGRALMTLYSKLK